MLLSRFFLIFINKPSLLKYPLIKQDRKLVAHAQQVTGNEGFYARILFSMKAMWPITKHSDSVLKNSLQSVRTY